MMRIESLDEGWNRLTALFGPSIDMDGWAKRCGALTRRREIGSAGDLLRLAMAYGPCGLSLRATSAWAALSGLAELSDVAVLKRLRACGPWLEELAGAALSKRLGAVSAPTGRVVRLYDATTVSSPGSDRADWRLHMSYDPRAGGWSGFKLTPTKAGETLTRAPIEKGEIWVADRGLAQGRGLAHVVVRGGDFVVRAGWNSLPLRDARGAPFDLAGKLQAMGSRPEACFEAMVALEDGQMPVRLLVKRKPPEAAAREIARLTTKAARRGRTRRSGKPDPRSLVAAHFTVLATSLAEPADQVFDLYALRWQIELAFKSLKTLLCVDRLRAFAPDLVQTALMAHVLAALIVDHQATEALDSPPSA